MAGETTWWDNEGRQWETWHGENWIIGYDESRIIQKTPQEIAKFEALMEEDDEWKKSHPEEPQRNILHDFITGLQAEIEFAIIVENVTGRDTKL